MANEVKLTAEQEAALSRIEAAVGGTRVKTAAEATPGDLCKKYQTIRKDLLVLITILKLIPKFGAKAAAAIEFLMSLADRLCPA